MLYHCVLALILISPLATAGEGEALAISQNIIARHMPFATVMDPMFGDNGEVTGYTRCGDSALWTGYYLAAEAFRYSVTKDPNAMANLEIGVNAIHELIRVTGRNVLARCMVPKNSPFADGIVAEESQSHAIYEGTCFGQACWWIGNTSRDQYVGAAFGLAVAYFMADRDDLRNHIRNVTTTLIGQLDDDDWSVKMPDGSTSTVFWQRFDQKLNLLMIARMMNPDRFNGPYSRMRLTEGILVSAPVAADVSDPHESYFKFNLLAATFFTLIPQEGNDFWQDRYRSAYTLFRRTVDDHQNAHFNMIDRAIMGPDARRDQETRDLLDQWLLRPRTDFWVDHRVKYDVCGENRACQAIPIEDRVCTDFLWQRSPFQLYGGRFGNIEGPGIDYILPYWMARHYGVI